LISISKKGGFVYGAGFLLVKSLPVIIRILSIVGTIALLLVSGGIFSHNIVYLHGLFPGLPAIITQLAIALLAGSVVVAAVTGGKKALSLLKQ
jgi:predicted DNA repair protein MutK